MKAALKGSRGGLAGERAEGEDGEGEGEGERSRTPGDESLVRCLVTGGRPSPSSRNAADAGAGSAAGSGAESREASWELRKPRGAEAVRGADSENAPDALSLLF